MRTMIAIALLAMSFSATAENKTLSIAKEWFKQTAENKIKELIVQPVEQVTGVSQIPTDPTQAVNRAITGKTEPDVFRNSAKKYWIEDQKHILASIGVNWDQLQTTYDSNDRIYELIQDDHLHIRYGYTNRMDYNWSVVGGAPSCDLIYMYFQHIPGHDQQMPQSALHGCILEERYHYQSMFSYLKLAQTSLGKVNPLPVVTRGPKAVASGIGKVFELAPSGSLANYNNDTLTSEQLDNFSTVSSMYGTISDHRFKQIAHYNKFFFTTEFCTWRYNEEKQTALVKFTFPGASSARPRTTDAVQTVSFSGSQFIKNPYAIEPKFELEAALNNSVVFEFPMTKNTYDKITQGLGPLAPPALHELYFTVNHSDGCQYNNMECVNVTFTKLKIKYYEQMPLNLKISNSYSTMTFDLPNSAYKNYQDRTPRR